MTKSVIGSNIKKMTDDEREFVSKLLRYAEKLAFSYCKKRNLSGQTLDDAKQIAKMGLMKASQLFDPEKGFQPTTYASWWIRSYLQRYVSQDQDRLGEPEYMHTARVWINKRSQEFYQIEGRQPTDNEKRDWLKDHYSCSTVKMGGKTISRVLEPERIYSVNQPMYSDGESEEFIDALTYDDDVRAEEAVCELEDVIALREAMRVLTPREKYVIVNRFGLEGHEPITLQQIGDVLRLSRERIRQIEVCAYEKMESHIRKRSPLSRTGAAQPEEIGVGQTRAKMMTARINKVSPFLLEDDDGGDRYVLTVGNRKMVFDAEEMSAIVRAAKKTSFMSLLC